MLLKVGSGLLNKAFSSRYRKVKLDLQIHKHIRILEAAKASFETFIIPTYLQVSAIQSVLAEKASRRGGERPPPVYTQPISQWHESSSFHPPAIT